MVDLFNQVDPVALAALIGFGVVMLIVMTWPLGFDEED